MEAKESFDWTRQIRQTEINEGDLVLWHNAIPETDMSQERKLLYKWLRLYCVQKAVPEKGTYILEEFNGTPLAGTYSSNRLKKFVERHSFYVPAAVSSDGGEDNECPEESESSEDEGSPPTEVPIQRSAQIQQRPN